MSDFKAKMHLNRFRLGLLIRLRWGAYSTPDPLAGFKGPASKGREGRKGEKWGKGEGRRDRGEEGKGDPKW